MATTSDGGASWTQVQTSLTSVEGASFADPLNGWAFNGSVLIRTTNGGSSWLLQSMHPAATGIMHDISFVAIPEPSALMLGGLMVVPMLMRRRR